MKFSFHLVAGLVVASALCGCSTWRCRGFLNTREKPADKKALANYRIASFGFAEFPTDEDELKKCEELLKLSKLDGSPYAPYREDLAKFAGLTNAAPGAKEIKVTVSQAPQNSTGWKTVFWPLCGTFGVMPAHFNEQVFFEVRVDFGSGKTDPVQALVSSDKQFGLSRYDMDMPPMVDGASAELRDDGTVGTGSELRDMRRREIFIRTVADAVLLAIAKHDKSALREVPTPCTEYGPIIFPEPAPEVTPEPPHDDIIPEPPKDPVVDQPEAPKPPVEIVDTKEAREDAKANPRDAKEKSLKELLQDELISEDDWWKQVSDHRKEIGSK